MHFNLSFSGVSFALCMLLPLLVLLTLYVKSLLKEYRFFAIMLAFAVIRDVVLLTIPIDSLVYLRAWSLSLWPWLILECATATVAYVAVARLYRGIGRFAGVLFVIGVAVGVCVAFCFFSRENAQHSWGEMTSWAFLLEQSASIILIAAWTLVFAFLRCFPRPYQVMPINVVRHLRILAAYFMISALYELLRSYGSQELWANHVEAIESIFFVLISACYLLWAVLLRRNGQMVEAWPPMKAHERIAIRDLNAQAISAASRIGAVNSILPTI